MVVSSELRTGRHCVFKMHVHLVFVSKYRRKVFSNAMLVDMEKYMRSVCDDFESELEEFNGEQDHVHLLVNYPPKVAVPKLVNSLKGVSSRLLQKEYPQIKEKCWKGRLWSPSYFASSCGGAPLDVLKNYIDSQARPA